MGALILTRAPGSGKSSILDALSTLLEIDGTSFGAIESEQLARSWPWLESSEWIRQSATEVAARVRELLHEYDMLHAHPSG